ncbi:MAG TPA: hypothetical protein VFH03_10985 [Actinoplanes sp.]|nr:hypothetical protein [Actinoplanes sp.]
MGEGDELVDWLLGGDTAVRWRVLRLRGAPPADVERERARVATEGWGARLLAEQDDDGRWGGGDYSPKWTSTTYTLLRLAQLGLPAGQPAALRGCQRLWQWQARWRVPETCITGLLIRLTCAHGYVAGRLDTMVADLLDQQQEDGGWNCATRDDRGRHSSFHTSILALEALDAYTGALDVAAAHRRGREFFLRHHLYQSHRTGAEAIPGSRRLRAFGEWHFDVLRGLEMFARYPDRDERLSDAIDVIRRARRGDGRWPVHAPYPGRSFFEPEPRGPSRWITVRALGVLDWWAAG